jgi:hypothetical protein
MYELDFTTLERMKAYIKIKASSTTEDDMLRGLIRAASLAIALALDRHIKLEEHTDYHDIYDDQRILWLRGWPFKYDSVAGEYMIEIVNDSNLPPTWTGTPLRQGQDYVVYHGEKGYGKVRFADYFTTGGVQALRVVATSGMASKTAVEGTTGTCTDPGGGNPHLFTDANATFDDDGLGPGMLIQITDNKNSRAGLYTISDVVDNNNLEITETWPGTLPGPADEVYIIQGAGLIGLYPNVELACQMQVALWYKRKETPEVSSISNAGGNVVYTKTRPLDVKLYGAQALATEALLLLKPHMQPETVYSFG